jgi:transposase
VRDFARATGKLAKTERLHAEALARFGKAVRPEARPLADKQAQALEALVTRRRQLVEMLTAEKNRRASAPKVLHRSIDEHIRWLEKRLAGFDDELGELIRNTPLWRESDELLITTLILGEIPARAGIVDLLDRLPDRATDARWSRLRRLSDGASSAPDHRRRRIIDRCPLANRGMASVGRSKCTVGDSETSSQLPERASFIFWTIGAETHST